MQMHAHPWPDLKGDWEQLCRVEAGGMAQGWVALGLVHHTSHFCLNELQAFPMGTGIPLYGEILPSLRGREHLPRYISSFNSWPTIVKVIRNKQ